MTGAHAAHPAASRAATEPPVIPPGLRKLIEDHTPLGVSLNDNWANYATDVPWLVHHLHPLLLGVQEGYRRNYHTLLGKRWAVRQRQGSKAEAGVALVLDRHRLHQIGHHRPIDHRPHLLGHGWTSLATAPDTRTRGVIWSDCELDKPITGLPDRFRAASWHRFPQRDRKHWPAFDRAARAWLHESPLPVIVFQDGNEHGGPDGILKPATRQYAWHADGNSIDGALVHASFHAGPVIGLEPRTSDHGAAVIPLGVTA